MATKLKRDEVTGRFITNGVKTRPLFVRIKASLYDKLKEEADGRKTARLAGIVEEALMELLGGADQIDTSGEEGGIKFRF